MKFEFSDELKEYMRVKKLDSMVVELVMCNNTEFEIAELHVHPVNAERAKHFIEEEGYGVVNTDFARVLLPRFKLKYKDTVNFGIKKVLWWNHITYEGIKVER